MRRLRIPCAVVAAAMAGGVAAGPVHVTLDGPRHCPRDRPADALPLTNATAVERARSMLPTGFCGPTRAVDGCDADTEAIADTFRVYFHQYKVRDGRHDWTLLTHAYVILDRTGNCLAHIPGTGIFEAAQ